jgi:hypothetical protein
VNSPETLSHDDYGDPLLPNPRVASPQKRKSNRRNDGRLTRAKEKDEKIISKYLCGVPSLLITSMVTGPNDHFTPSAWLMEAVSAVANQPVGTPNKPPIHFSMDNKATQHNSRLLEDNGFNFNKFIEANRNTTLDYGSEFRPLHQLEKILGTHPHFQKLSKILSNGMFYQFTWSLPENLCEQELAAIIKRGNHKSAEKRMEHIAKADV